MNRVKLLLLFALLAGCKEKYNAPVPKIFTGYLVVEGVIDNGGSATNIRLSRTTNLDDVQNVKEKDATIQLESSNNTILPLHEFQEGSYTMDNANLDTTQQYRLHIKTTNNEEYISDPVHVKYNPPIDSVSWLRDNDGVTLYINTHDGQNSTHYYQWDYNETWEFHAAYQTSLKYIKDVYGNSIGVTLRESTDPLIFVCWQFNASDRLMLGSSAKLSRDAIYLPLTSIPVDSWKLSVLYSIHVNQYAWPKEGFEFLERMKKNTESVGSIFDAQPSELNGNIKCVSNPSQPVIGYFNICPVRQQRIFIYNNQLPGWHYAPFCPQIIIENNFDSIARKGFDKLPVSVASSGPQNSIETFSAAPSTCVDCTLSGVNVKPDYWP